MLVHKFTGIPKRVAKKLAGSWLEISGWPWGQANSRSRLACIVSCALGPKGNIEDQLPGILSAGIGIEFHGSSQVPNESPLGWVSIARVGIQGEIGKAERGKVGPMVEGAPDEFVLEVVHPKPVRAVVAFVKIMAGRAAGG